MNRFNFNLNYLELCRIISATGIQFDIQKYMLGVLTILLTYFFLGDVYLYLLIQGSDGKMPMGNRTTVPCHPQPYCHLDMKSLFLDLPNFYIHHPLSAWIYEWTKFGNNFSFISANAISMLHLLLAMISAKCISNDYLCVRRIGVGFFALRNFLDAFDGTVARARRKELVRFNSNAGSTGYWIDGLVDALGITFLLAGCLFYILKNLPPRYQFTYSPLLSRLNKSSDERTEHWETTTTVISRSTTQIITCGIQSGFQPVILGVQCFISSACWNRYIALYSELLQEGFRSAGAVAVGGDIREFQGRAVKSSMMWVVIMLWRLFNVHSIVEMLLAAIFFDKMVEFMTFIQFVGFLPLGIVVFFSEVHVNDIQQVVNALGARPSS